MLFLATPASSAAAQFDSCGDRCGPGTRCGAGGRCIPVEDPPPSPFVAPPPPVTPPPAAPVPIAPAPPTVPPPAEATVTPRERLDITRRRLDLQAYGLFVGLLTALDGSGGRDGEFTEIELPFVLGGPGLSVDVMWQATRIFAVGLHGAFTRQTIEFDPGTPRVNALWSELGFSFGYTAPPRRNLQIFGETTPCYLGSLGRVEDIESHGVALRAAIGIRVPRTQGPAFVARAVLVYPLWMRMRVVNDAFPSRYPAYLTLWPPLGVSMGVSWGSGAYDGGSRRSGWGWARAGASSTSG